MRIDLALVIVLPLILMGGIGRLGQQEIENIELSDMSKPIRESANDQFIVKTRFDEGGRISIILNLPDIRLTTSGNGNLPKGRDEVSGDWNGVFTVVPRLTPNDQAAVRKFLEAERTALKHLKEGEQSKTRWLEAGKLGNLLSDFETDDYCYQIELSQLIPIEDKDRALVDAFILELVNRVKASDKNFLIDKLNLRLLR